MIVGALTLCIFVAVVCWCIAMRPRERDTKLPAYDETLSPKVSAYLTVNMGNVLGAGTYDVFGNLLISHVENYCDVLIYGHDEQYIYSYATCQEYGWSYRYDAEPDMSNTVRITRSVVRGTGWSTHVRLAYTPGTDFEITSYDSPRSGRTYYEDLGQMFAPMGMVGRHDDPEVFDRLLERFRYDHTDDPYPDKIEKVTVKIDLFENPQVVIGGEVEE